MPGARGRGSAAAGETSRAKPRRQAAPRRRAARRASSARCRACPPKPSRSESQSLTPCQVTVGSTTSGRGRSGSALRSAACPPPPAATRRAAHGRAPAPGRRRCGRRRVCAPAARPPPRGRGGSSRREPRRESAKRKRRGVGPTVEARDGARVHHPERPLTASSRRTVVPVPARRVPGVGPGGASVSLPAASRTRTWNA